MRGPSCTGHGGRRGCRTLFSCAYSDASGEALRVILQRKPYNVKMAPKRKLPAPEVIVALTETMTHAEIAEMYGATTSGVVAALYRAKSKSIRRRPLEERFWEKVDKDGPVPDYRPDLGPCWIWTGSRDQNDYGRFFIERAVGTRRAHTVAYQLVVGAVPEGLVLDHLCRVPPCCNPSHLEPVTMRENIVRGISTGARNAKATHCIRGHAFTEENTYLPPSGGRQCVTCNRQFSGTRRPPVKR